MPRPHRRATISIRTGVALITLLVAAPAATAIAQPVRFAIQEIPTLGGSSSYARDISNSGLVTGNDEIGRAWGINDQG